MATIAYEMVLEEAQQLTREEQRRLRDELTTIVGNAEGQPTRRRRSSYGALAHLGPAPSAEDIDEARREAWANFPREDIA